MRTRPPSTSTGPSKTVRQVAPSSINSTRSALDRRQALAGDAQAHGVALAAEDLRSGNALGEARLLAGLIRLSLYHADNPQHSRRGCAAVLPRYDRSPPRDIWGFADPIALNVEYAPPTLALLRGRSGKNPDAS